MIPTVDPNMSIFSRMYDLARQARSTQEAQAQADLARQQAQLYTPKTQADIAEMQARTGKEAAETGLTQQQTQWFGPTSAADIAYKRAVASGIPSEIALRQAQASAIPSEIGLRQAQAAEAYERAQPSPLFGAQAKLQEYIDKYGPADPRTKLANENYRQLATQLAAQTDWKQQLAATMPERVLSTQGKLVNEATAMQAGYAPSAAAAIGASPYGTMPNIVPQPSNIYGALGSKGVTTSTMDPLSILTGRIPSYTNVTQPTVQQGIQPTVSQITEPANVAHPTQDHINALNQQSDIKLAPRDVSSFINVGKDIPSSQDMAGSFFSHAIKTGLTTQAANKIVNGTNAAVTIKTIDGMMNDPDVLNNIVNNYSGYLGRVKLFADSLRNGMGNNIPSYNTYSSLQTQLHILNDQVTQYFGTSITPAQTDKLEKAINALDDSNLTPEGVKMKWQSFKDVFQQELENTREFATSPSKYITPVTAQDFNSGAGFVDVKGTGHTLDEFKAAAAKNGVKDVEGFVRSYKESKGIK